MTVRLAVAGWSLFIAENVVLSENRTRIIQLLDDDEEESKYHILYGSCSTIATAAILYGFFKCRKAGPYQFPLYSIPSRARVVIAFALQATGCIGLTQLAPRMQMPVIFTPNETDVTSLDKGINNQALQQHNQQSNSSTEGKRSLKIRCPFDFSPSHNSQNGLAGIDRVTRHPALWSMACVGLGQAVVSSSIPLAAWYCMPTAVALIGGSHHDSRFQRGIGGYLHPDIYIRTSNIPFYGMIFGDQSADGGTKETFAALSREVKTSNLVVGAAMALLMAARRIR